MSKKWWLITAAVAVLIIFVFAAGSYGLLGENFQGMIRLQKVPVKRTTTQDVKLSDSLQDQKGIISDARNVLPEIMPEETTDDEELPAPPPNPNQNPSEEVCWEAYEYLRTHSGAELSQWMNQTGIPGTPNLSQSDLIYCRDSVVGASLWYSGNLTASQCQEIYDYLKANGSSALSTWMASNNYSASDAEYCKNTYYSTTWHDPSEEECKTMYDYLRENGGSALSTWMTSNNYTASDSVFCKNTYYGQYWHHPTDLECTNMYNYFRTNSGAALSTWMQNNNLYTSDVEYCTTQEIPNDWWNPDPSYEECMMMKEYYEAYGVQALSDWLDTLNLNEASTTWFCANSYPSDWY